MSLQALPNEVVANILHIIRLSEPDNKPEFLTLRLVCRQFDDHASRIALQTSSPSELDIGRRKEWRLSVEWMMTTKARINLRDTTGPFAFIHDAAEYLLNRNLMPELTPDGAVVAACRAIVAVHDPSWVVNHFVSWEPGNPLPESLSHLATYTRKERNINSQDKEENLNELYKYGIVHLLLACDNDSAVESAINDSTTLGGFQRKHRHAVFGDVMRSAIVLEHVAGIRALLQHGFDPNAVDVNDRESNALAYAAEMNREKAVKTILTVPNDVKINVKGRLGLTALGWAARRGWTEIVQLLLQRDEIDPNLGKTWGETPLVAAARHDHETIARLLIDRSEIKRPFGSARYCPLWVALECGSTNVVRLFLDKFGDEIDLNQEMRSEHTPLCLAASLGFTPLVRMLLEVPGVKPDLPDTKTSHTPLGQAILGGHTEVVRTLLNYDVDIFAKVDYKMPVPAALERGYIEISELLLYKTLATGDRRCLELLWNFEIDANHRLEAVRILMKDAQFRQNNKEELSKLLWYAAKRSEVDIAEELLKYAEVDPNLGGSTDYPTPLLVATRDINRSQAVPALLARKDVDVNRFGRDGTAFLASVIQHDARTMDALLEHPDIDVNCPGPKQRGMLWKFTLRQPAKNYHLSRKRPFKVDWEWSDHDDKKIPLLVAAEDKLSHMFESIYDHPQINKRATDAWNRSALWWAVKACDKAMVKKILQCTPDIKDIINLQDEEGWAPLHIAANSGFVAIAGMLLRHPDIDPNVATAQGWTALHMSLVTCMRKLAMMLLNHPKIDPSLKLDDGRTASDLHKGCECEIADEINVSNIAHKNEQESTT